AITDFNQAAEELTGVTAANARGRPAGDVLHVVDEDGRDLSRRLTRLSPNRWTAIGELDAVPVAISAGALRDASGEVAGAVYVLRDLRREREVEQMKTEFLSRVGHELRT